MTPRPMIIDCDPGQDDALAILMALGSPEEIDLLAVTVVAGNVPLTLTEKNARKIVALAGRPDLPVHAGCDRPLVRELITAEEVHGKTGLDGPDLPEPEQPLAPGHAVDVIIEILRSHPAGSVTICPIGPLTNIAMAMKKAPDILPRIKEIVLMGGAINEGNITPSAEFNLYVDPHAAAIVFRSGVKLTMHGLDVTHQALVSPPRLEAIRAINSKVGEAAFQMLSFFNIFDEARSGGQGGPLHDPCAIAYCMRPDLFSGRLCEVEIETSSPLTMGRTVVAWRDGLRPNDQDDGRRRVRVIDQIDADGFFAFLTERLARLPIDPQARR